MSSASTTSQSVASLEAAGREIWCCGCNEPVMARLTDGGEIYPHRRDLYSLPFWKCDTCGNFVGCHHKTKNRTKPLGCIPTREIKNARSHIHRVLDPVWKSRRMSRSDAYASMADALGIGEYHTAELRTIEACRDAYRAARDLAARTATPEAAGRECAACGGKGTLLGMEPDCCGDFAPDGSCRGHCCVPRETQEQCSDCCGQGVIPAARTAQPEDTQRAQRANKEHSS